MIKTLFCLLMLTVSFSGNTQNSSQKDGKEAEVHVKQTPDFEVSGDGSAVQWKAAGWTKLTPRHGARSGYESKVKLLYSSSGIYCLFSCKDAKITSTLTEDFTNLYLEDVVEIFFWPDESVPVYFEYELSPHNYELAIIVPNRHGNFLGWRPWHYEGGRMTRHATKIILDKNDVDSWIAEFFIPFTLLKPLLDAPPQHGTRWRANMYRIDYDEGDSEWSWQLTGENFHDYEKFGTLVFD